MHKNHLRLYKKKKKEKGRQERLWAFNIQSTMTVIQGGMCLSIQKWNLHNEDATYPRSALTQRVPSQAQYGSRSSTHVLWWRYTRHQWDKHVISEKTSYQWDKHVIRETKRRSETTRYQSDKSSSVRQTRHQRDKHINSETNILSVRQTGNQRDKPNTE